MADHYPHAQTPYPRVETPMPQPDPPAPAPNPEPAPAPEPDPGTPAPEPPPPPEPAFHAAGDDVGPSANRRLLELNGYNAIRHEALAALNALAAIPPAAWTAALDYNNAARARLAVNPDSQASEAYDAAHHEHALLKTGMKVAAGLRDLADKQARRDRLTAR